MFVKYLLYFQKLILSNIFQIFKMFTHFNIFENITIIVQEHYTFWALFTPGMVKYIKLNNQECFKTLTWCYSWRLSWPNRCLESINHFSSHNKPWMWRGKIFHGLSENILPCHRIFRDMAKYSTPSLNNIHVAK